MKTVNKKALVSSTIGNKETDQADPRLYKKVYAEFIKLSWIWGKSFMIFLMERCEDRELVLCAKKLHLEMKYKEKEVYDRYMHHFLQELKKDFFKAQYGGTLDNIGETMITYGLEEFLVLNRVVFNCTDKFKFENISWTQDMRKEIERSYYD